MRHLSGRLVVLGALRLNPAYLVFILSTVVVVAALFLFFGYSKFGKAMRATALDPIAAKLMGIRIGSVFSAAWALSTMLGAFVGLLLAPVIGINPEIGHLILKGLVAAVIGGFSSLGGAVVGGLLLGLLETYAGAFFGATFKNSGAVRRAHSVVAAAPAGSCRRLQHATGVAVRMRVLLILAGLALLAALPLVATSYYLYLAELAMINVIVAVGLNLLSGNCGQISLCNASFMGIGAYCTALCTSHFGLPTLIALPASVVVSAVLGRRSAIRPGGCRGYIWR